MSKLTDNAGYLLLGEKGDRSWFVFSRNLTALKHEMKNHAREYLLAMAAIHGGEGFEGVCALHATPEPLENKDLYFLRHGDIQGCCVKVCKLPAAPKPVGGWFSWGSSKSQPIQAEVLQTYRIQPCFELLVDELPKASPGQVKEAENSAVRLRLPTRKCTWDDVIDEMKRKANTLAQSRKNGEEAAN